MLPPEKAGTRKWNSVSRGKGVSWKCAVYIDFLTIMCIYSQDSLGTFTYQDSVIQNFFKWVGIFKIPLTLKADFSRNIDIIILVNVYYICSEIETVCILFLCVGN